MARFLVEDTPLSATSVESQTDPILGSKGAQKGVQKGPPNHLN